MMILTSHAEIRLRAVSGMYRVLKQRNDVSFWLSLLGQPQALLAEGRPLQRDGGQGQAPPNHRNPSGLPGGRRNREKSWEGKRPAHGPAVFPQMGYWTRGVSGQGRRGAGGMDGRGSRQGEVMVGVREGAEREPRPGLPCGNQMAFVGGFSCPWSFP